MKALQTAGLTVVLMALMALPAQADIRLFDFGLNVDGASFTECGSTFPNLPCPPGALPAGADASGYDWMTGMGTFELTVMGLGPHYAALWADQDINEGGNTAFQEYGTVTGVADAGQFYEIDEPGFVFGDIYDNWAFSAPGANLLDGTNGVPGPPPCDPGGLPCDDVSMAIGWDFTLVAGKKAVIEWVFAPTAPAGGFYLTHHDEGTADKIYYSSTLMMMDIGPPGVPEPSTLLLLGGGLIGGLGFARRKNT